jgi:hypothetical protein
LRRLLRSNGIKGWCYTLVLALLCSTFPAYFGTPAQAQIVPLFQVAVVDFVNESGVQGPLLARLATDAVVVEMGKTNRYDVGITRSQIDSELDKIGLKQPLGRVGLVRLAKSLAVDAIVQGSIKSVSVTGAGDKKQASVTLAVEMIDAASGESINGALQTGRSEIRVGYVADDDTLITEAINNAAFLAVEQMISYVIPEASVTINIGADRVMLNKGVRDGIREGMRMIVLRRGEIIGYIDVQTVDPMDSIAKVVMSARGIKPEDKVRAIYELPTKIVSGGKEEPLPMSAPKGGAQKKGILSTLGKFIVGAVIVYGIAQIFRSGRGGENAPPVSIDTASNTIIRWDPSKFGHGTNVLEYQVLRDDFADTAAPVKSIRDPSLVDSGQTNVRSLYGTTADIPVTYYSLAANPATSFTEKTFSVPSEDFGQTHSYQVRVVYKTTLTAGSTEYRYSPVSSTVVATAIQPVRAIDMISPAFDPASPPPSIQLSDLQSGVTNFQWNRKEGATVYYMTVDSVVPGIIGSFSSLPFGLIYDTGAVIELSAAQRTALVDFLTRSRISSDTVLKWKVFCRNTADTSPAFTAGEDGRFTVGETPPPPP